MIFTSSGGMAMNMIAHIRKMDNTAQPLAEHCRTVGALCAKAGRKIDLEKTAQLIGLMHDMGKATADFAAYLMTAEDGAASPHNH